MSVNISVRLDDRLAERLRLRARAAGVWEVAMWIDDLGAVEDPAAELATDGTVTRPQIDAALAYRAAYPDEIEARIELHRSETAAAEAR